jgi:hypothetical protein
MANPALQFALNGNAQNPHCLGVRGLLDAYAAAIHRVTLWGPTNFAPIIRHTVDVARSSNAGAGEQKYVVLLILTDGAITDMYATKVCMHMPAPRPRPLVLSTCTPPMASRRRP